jgi:5,10-methylenetetrahydromethanopterin reductase
MVTLGINIIPDRTIDGAVAIARAAEGADFKVCRVYDEGLVTHDVYVVAAAILMSTEHLTVGPGITNPYTRHPAQTAVALASLDALAPGRVVSGFGPGGTLTLDPMGIDRRQPLAALADLMTACRELWTGATVNYAGTTIGLRAATLGSGAVGIPVWLAGRGPKVLELGGTLADGVMLDFLHEATLMDSAARVRAAGAKVGREPMLSYSTSVILNPDDLEAVRPHITYRLVDSPAEIRARIGLDEASRQRIRDALTDGLAAAAAEVRDEWIMPFVLHGDEHSVRYRFVELCERIGADEFILPVFDMPDPCEYVDRVGRVLSR